MKRRDIFGAYHFAIRITGIEDAFFRSCSGLRSESEIYELQEGGLNTTTHKLIGRNKYPNLMLRQGFSGPPFTLWSLRRRYLSDDNTPIKRFSGAIVQLGPRQRATWSFENGWICKWEGPDFDASKNELSIEMVEIAHSGLTKLT